MTDYSALYAVCCSKFTGKEIQKNRFVRLIEKIQGKSDRHTRQLFQQSKTRYRAYLTLMKSPWKSIGAKHCAQISTDPS